MAKKKAPVKKDAATPYGAGGVTYGGFWPDGTLKLLGPDGKVLPQGSHLDISGNQVHVIGSDGSPVQLTSSSGQVYTPVKSINDLPAGSYDPNIDYQSGAANRGVGYAQQDYGTNYALPTGASLTDLLNGATPSDINAQDAAGNYVYGRGVRDFFQNRDRTNQDYNTQTAALGTQYQRLGQNQFQAINAGGDLGGGALAQSVQKRTANQAVDQSGIDTAHSRTLADLLTGVTRGATDAYTTLQRTVGENAPYQGALTATAAQESQRALVNNPNYEVHNGTIYQRQPSGGVTAVAKAAAPKKVKKNPWANWEQIGHIVAQKAGM